MSKPLESSNSAPWTRRRQDIGATVWCAFLAACLATMLFFASFDPVLLMHDDDPPGWLADRRSGYALGFLFFWSIGIIAASLTAWMIDTRRDADLQSQGSSHD